MKVIIDGRELRVARSTRTLVEWQNQSGHPMGWLASDEGQAYSLAFQAFCALHNAGFEPKWEQLLDVDTAEWVFIKEPSDERGVALDPARSLDGSDLGVVGANGQDQPGSTRSTKPKGGSKSK